MNGKRDEALKLAEELLTDIELERLKPTSVIRKASRLARLMDDMGSSVWLGYEISGYPSQGNGKGLSQLEWAAAVRSGRRYLVTKDGETKEYANSSTIAELQANVESAKTRLAHADSSNIYERNAQQQTIASCQGIIDKVLGSIYQYAVKTHHELRFGAAVATAFESLRNTVDTQIASLVPDALPILSTALENAQTDNPEQWKNAAKACRDLIKATADALRPPGPDKEIGSGKKIKMGDDNYVNRLVDWIETHSTSTTKKNLVKSDLEHLGQRLDATTDGGNKGAHAKVSKTDASRFIVGTYVLLGDILSLNTKKQTTPQTKH